jgi:hypothetical protein
MRRAAQAVADEEGRRRSLDALDVARITALLETAAALDRSPSNASLMHEYRGLMRDLRLEAGGQGDTDLDDLVADFRSRVSGSAAVRVLDDAEEL